MKPLALLLTALAACGATTKGPPVTTVTLWHAYSDAEEQVLVDLAAQWNADHQDVKLRLVSVPYDAFPDKVSAAIPNGNGPDLFVFAHDRIGDWAEAGILDPIEFFVDDALADRFDDAAITAMAYKGSLYGLPLTVKSLALYYRTDLVPVPPATTDELLAIGRKLTDREAGRFGLAYENYRLYGNAGWLYGFGARIFDDQGRLDLASPEAVRAMVFIRALGGDGGIVPAETTSTLVTTLFLEGRAGMVLSGPWFIGGIPKDVPWKVAPLPTISETGRPAAPFLGAEGVMMSARATDKRAAFAVMNYLTSDASAIARAVAAREVVPNRAAYDDPRVSADAVLTAFRRQAEVSTPMPSTPEMRMVWTPYDAAIQKILTAGADPAAALAAAQHEIQGYIQGAR